MTGRVAIVTGANTGIGYQVTRYLAEGGNDVVMACRSVDKGKEAMARIKAEYPNSLVQVMEVSEASDCTSFKEYRAENIHKL
jgi:NAD(P)-dependent dehydrogenase (short-subunit alcohol dehydrogenase family)